MKQQHIDDQVLPYPKIRRFMEAAFRSTHHKPMIHGLLEVDVSRARAHLRDYKANTGEALSFTAFLIACLTKAVVGGSKALQFLPAFLFRPYFWVFSWIGRRYPPVWKKNWGTVALSAVGMVGKGAGWGIPPATPSLWMTVGGIGEKPGVVDGQIVMRDYLSLTISFDHNMIDGAPVARFTERLKELIESGYGLIDQEASTALNESKPQPQEV